MLVRSHPEHQRDSPREKLSILHNKDIKCTEQRKDFNICKEKRLSHIKLSQKGLDSCCPTSSRGHSCQVSLLCPIFSIRIEGKSFITKTNSNNPVHQFSSTEKVYYITEISGTPEINNTKSEEKNQQKPQNTTN